MDPTPGIRIISHEEVERNLDWALRPVPGVEYNNFMDSLRESHPRIYGILRYLGLDHY